METKVSSITKTDKIVSEEETTIYKLVLKGDNSLTGYDKVKVQVTLESESKETIEELCPMEMFAERVVTLRPLNHDLGEYRA